MYKNDPIVLFTPYFTAKTNERQRELDTCLKINIANRYISKILLLIDDGHMPPVKDDKLQIVPISRRPTYRQWIELNRKFTEPHISVLANTDIYFDESISEIKKFLSVPQSFIALSRYEKTGESTVPHANPHWSQDVWALHTDSKVEEPLVKALDVPLGVPRCDNKVAYLFGIHGWRLFNPVHYVRSIHFHESQQRNYEKKSDLTVIGGVAYVYPNTSYEVPSQIQIDIWVKNSCAISSVTLNKSLDAWSKEDGQLICVDGDLRPAKVANLSRPVCETNALSKNDSRVSVADRYKFVMTGDIVFDHMRRFRIYRHSDELLCLDWLQPNLATRLGIALPEAVDVNHRLSHDVLALFIPPVVDNSPIKVRERPANSSDSHFWQYPCATEKQAYDNHLAIGYRQNLDVEKRIIHTYLGLPWATYIDRKHLPDDVLARLRPRLAGYKKLARAHGYDLAIHTVCQQIHWERLIEQFNDLSVTDLHLSHCERKIDPMSIGLHACVHSWPLIAVNIEDRGRSGGIERGKPIANKRFLASFIGAHMTHYRSDVRLRLLEAAKADGATDIFFDLGGEWHFNKIVYQEQVQNKVIGENDQRNHDAATLRYNRVLSDSIFSICPEGAGPNTLRIWESLAVGSIPIIIADDWIPPETNCGISMMDCCLFVHSSEIDNGFFRRLRTIKYARLKAMQSACMNVYERIRSLTTYIPLSSTKV